MSDNQNPSKIEKAYEAGKYEDSIYKKWLDQKCFAPTDDRDKKPFTVSLPPPNATGKLHLGHATMVAIQDIMVRWRRMKGDNALWIPGTDHAAIATQSVVEKKLQDEGMKKPRVELGREKFLQEVHRFAEESKKNIRSQIKKMGASCDWDREKYTMEPALNHAVNTFFEKMFADGLIYRGGRIVNWDPKMETTVADDEMEHVEEKTKFYYFQYGPVVIGTARPETKFLDKVVVVHPDDKRYQDLIGKEFEVEWIEGKIKAKLIADDCIDMEMGTGAMTITPAHSLVDFEIAERHNLESEQIIDFEGKIRPEVSEEFGGMNIKEAREKIVEKLDKKGLLVRVDEEYIHNIAVNYRGKGQIEPQIMKQWFVDVNKKVIDWKGEKLSIKEVLQDVVRSEMIEIVPERFNKIYFHWIDNLRDWCISRQIWWGHRIPVWYKCSKEKAEDLQNSPEIKVGESKPESGPNFDWVRDPDTLDTWFSAALWTFATLGWPEKTEDLEYFHPTAVLETGYDILFFWVARMILASTYALRKDGFSEEKSIPFKKVYLHGLVRDKNGKKMSKSRPETCIDPLDMTSKYGADALRLSLVIGSTPGNDMRLYEEKIAGYRNFINKIWNASRFALMNVNDEEIKKLETTSELELVEVKALADKWILTELQGLIKDVDQDLQNDRLSDAGNKIYEFLWNKYCDWYLELSKGENQNSLVLLFVLKETLKLLHPFVPFVTEKLWEFIEPGNLLIKSDWPKYNPGLDFSEAAQKAEIINELISEIRKIRAEAKVEPAKQIKAIVYGGNLTEEIKAQEEAIKRLARLETLEISESGEKITEAKFGLVGKVEIYLPLAGMLDLEKEKKRLEKEIEKKTGFIKSLNSKLGNPGFVKNAPPEVIEQQKNRLKSEEENLQKLKDQLERI